MSAAAIVHPDPEVAATLLRANPDYRVLRRFVQRLAYADQAPANTAFGLYVDVEGTGLDTTVDRIIELAMVPFTFDHCGRVYAVGPGLSYYQDPGIPIPREVTALTGITDNMVAGQSIDEAMVNHALRDAALVVAHNASYDRPMLERPLPAFAEKHWACSYREVEWERFGCVGAKLPHILEGTCSEFYDAHRAIDDARVGVHVLAAAQLDGRTALSYLLDSARRDTARVWALGSPYATKDALKRRKYRWADGSSGAYKSWYVDIPPDDVDREIAWLRENAFVSAPVVERFSARDRYSARVAA